ncbi:pyridoxamine 5'-phosphate oxidase family protein [Nocardioides rubriscoriae]|uniref:pyridoxamine 5'-phosphate oxidase family protein n=1 Tax=Nocardioides rubriscoriae TaxID=642762 RepID=UPI0011DF9D60|nr:pyridoxamine 5'-phosphate oxidase family protein [Nocardioides rubriscoriae]
MTNSSTTGGHGTAATRHLVDLSNDECWDLLRGTAVGRLAWNGTDGPTVVPVNFAVTTDGIDVRTTAYSAVAREADDGPVSFQADHLDPVTRTGWSVLAHGHVQIDWSFGRVDAPEIDVWPTGPRSLRLHVEIEQISGRRLA